MSGDAVLPSVPGAAPRQTMSLPHNIHPDQMAADQPGNRWKRFQPLKKLQRMFRRKSKAKDEDGYPEAPKSFSASHLLPGQQRRTSQRDSPPMQSRLSMSHDSIFQSEGQQPDDMGSTLSIPGASRQVNAELRGVLLKRRGDDSDDDPGLPHSPATPPTASTRLQKELKGQSGKSGGSCSDGSLLSMYSSGTCTDEDIFGPLSTHHSRASLARDQDALELETSAALSHSAAKHRIAVRPRRNHGAPRQHRRTRPQPSPAATGLPPTVEEESPPATPASAPATAAAAVDRVPAATASSASPRLQVERARRTPSASPSRNQSKRATSPDGASSAPPRPTPVKRSKSSVADRRLRDLSPRKFWSRDPPSPVAATAAAAAGLEGDDKKAEGFFSRIFGSRRSGRGKRKEGGSLSPDSAAEEAAAARPPAAPRSSHRQRTPRARSPPSALHADVIRPPPSSIPADVIRPLPQVMSEMAPWQSGSITSGTASSDMPASRGPPEALMRRGGPAFLADVRAEVRALATGGDRGDDCLAVSPQLLRRQRASALPALAGRGGESPCVRPRLVGLTSYQQRVAQMQGAGSLTPERETKRRSFSCENISEEGIRRDSCSGMALGSVLSLIKATTVQEQESVDSKRNSAISVKEEESRPEETVVSGFGVALRSVRREADGSPTAGPKSLDSSLRSGVSESSTPPQKASSAESVQSSEPPVERVGGGRSSPPERRTASTADAVPEFLKVHLQVVEGRQSVVEPVPAPRQREDSGAVSASPQGENWRASLKSSAASAGSVPLYSPSCEKRSSVAIRDSELVKSASEECDACSSETSRSNSAESPPILRRPVPAPRSGSPDAHRRSSQAARAKPAVEPAAAEAVILRSKPSATEDSELLKVFKRRSLRTRDPDDSPQKPSSGVTTTDGSTSDEKGAEQPREETEETVASVSREVPETKEPAEPARHRRVGDCSPAKLRRAEFPRTARPPSTSTDAPPPRPSSEARSTTSEARSTVSEARSTVSEARSTVSEARSVASEGRPTSATSSESEQPRRVSVTRRESESRRLSQPEDDAAGWLKQTVKERREQREQRELKHLRPAQSAAVGQKELIIEPESAVPGRTVAAARSSRVLQMANTFQKLQTT